MKLIEPTIEYDLEIQAFRREFPQSASMDGSNRLMQYERTQDWLEQIELYRYPETVPEGKVPIRQFIYVRESDRKVLGVIQIRLWLNDYLLHYGGHIGYSICPSERRKGYAKQMLNDVLPICKSLGIDRVLICCLVENEASRRTILHNGGVYESTEHEPEQNLDLQRYWISI